MKPTIYIETTVVSYLTAWPSRDLIIAAHQQLTRDWWKNCRERFQIVASELVVRESKAGDAEAARERLLVLDTLTLLEITDSDLELAGQLIAEQAVPKKAAEDALHLALAATNGIDYLVTWNCRHLANALMRARIELVCRAAGYQPPIICTPEELLEEDPDEE